MNLNSTVMPPEFKDFISDKVRSNEVPISDMKDATEDQGAIMYLAKANRKEDVASSNMVENMSNILATPVATQGEQYDAVTPYLSMFFEEDQHGV